MRSRRDDLGITTKPCAMCQATITCAVVASCLAAIEASVGSLRLLTLNGLYPSSTTPRCRSPDTTAGSYSAGPQRIWLTSGVVPVASVSSSI